MLAVQGRLRALLKANHAVVQQLELPVVLRRIVESATELVGAEYGALGVVNSEGRLQQFITVGMSEEIVARIGELPEGHGLLGALIDEPLNIRLPRLSDDPRSVGFPAGHPPMESFLGVPIRVRDQVYGNLYLSNQKSGEFSSDDEQLVTALAATAGIAIDNARLFAETRRRQAWSAASAEITSTLLSSEHNDTISTVASRVLTLAEADFVWVLLPTGTGEEFLVERARGLESEAIEGTTLSARGSTFGAALDVRAPQLVSDAGTDAPQLADGRRMGPLMVVPLVGSIAPRGVLLVGRVAGGDGFAPADLEMAADFAGQASIAMELAEARLDSQRMVLLEDRGRIARDLHDHVIQQLFATGLQLHTIAGRTAGAPVAADVLKTVANIDSSIAQIRTAIFALNIRDDESNNSMRHRVIDLVNEMSPGFPSTPTVSFSGPVDLVISEELADDVIAVAREALANVIKHAFARHAALSLTVADDTVSLTISDDGVGFSAATRRSGIANLEARATQRGGTFELGSTGDGTTLSWKVPFGLATAELAV
ncbi:GAF domain-containing protein [Conyzicola sp.]|uniref:sensor histidine kinase n=1 Tax=Conyzicola sp. TaxID=1969404 RepID=UPI0039899C6F